MEILSRPTATGADRRTRAPAKITATSRSRSGALLIGLLLATALAPAAPAAPASPAPIAASLPPVYADNIDRYLQAEMQRQKIPGLTLAIARNGKPLYVKGYGVATLEHPVNTKPDSVYQIGSIGKQFTATAVMLLAREHRLDLDDPLSKYLPEIPAAWSQVTLRLILNHQSGIAQFTTPTRQLLDLGHDYTDAELIALASSQPLDFEPGTDVSYSDTGYVLMGFVVNRVAGMFYGDFLQQRIFAPLGMGRTRIISDTDIVPDRTSGYELNAAGELRNQTAVSPALNRTADGSLYSTVLDLMKWDRALYGDDILTQAELQRMWSVDAHRNGQRPLYHYGYGWEDIRLQGHRLIEYDGNWQGFQAVMSRYVDDGLTIIIMTNLALCRTERLSHTVAGLVDPALKPYGEAASDSMPRLTAGFRRFLEEVANDGAAATTASVANGHTPAPAATAAAANRRHAARTTAASTNASAMPSNELSREARAKLLPSALHTLARELRELGPIQRYSLAQSDTVAGKVQRVYRVEGKDMVDFFTVRYTRDARIDDLDLLQEF